MTITITRRSAILGIAAAALVHGRGSYAAALLQVTVTKDPNCGCCNGWVEHLRAAGFSVTVVDTAEINRVKARLGVPHDLQSCHTAEVAGYVLEGHVPAAAVTRLLEEKPQARGLAVPGMPIGSPGMEVEGTPAEEYAVVLFGPAGRKTFARFRGPEEIKRSGSM